MKLIPHNPDFSPALMFECGQCFRFTQIADGVYRGTAFERVLTLTDTPDGVLLDCSQEDYDNIWHNYFDLSLDYQQVREKINVTDFLNTAIAFGCGIRILRQDFWEALCSFIISQCNNIPRIRGIIERMCAAYGTPICDGYNTFPSPQTVARLSVDNLRAMGAGYRAEYILNAARAVNDDVLSADGLSNLSFDAAKKELLSIHGIGDKVANCVLLYGLHRLDAFPIDVWMKRALDNYFPPDFNPAVFGEYAGIAQQYIFHYTRALCKKTS